MRFWCGGYSSGMGGGAEGIGLASWDGARFVYLGSVARMPSPSFLARDGAVLAAVDEETGSVRTFATHGSGELTPLGAPGGVSTSGPNPCHVRFVTVEGVRMLLVTNYGSGGVDLFRCDADGGVRELLDVFAGAGTGPRSEQDGPHAHSTLVVEAWGASAGVTMLSADLGADRVYAHRLTTAGLEVFGSYRLPAGTGPRDLLAVGGRVLLLGEFGGHLFELDADLSTPRALGPVAQGAEGDQAAGLAFSAPSGLLLAGLRGTNRLAAFDAARSERLGAVDCRGDWPRHVAVAGETVFVSNQRSDSVTVFSTAGAGLPVFVGEASAPAPTCLLPLD